MARWASAREVTSGTDELYGKMKTIIVRREKLVELLFPLTGFMIVVIVHPAFPLDKTAQLESLLRNLKVGGDEWRSA